MQYMLLIYDDASVWAKLGEDERNGLMGDYFTFTEEVQAAGAYVAGAPLQGTETAQTVRLRDGDELVTDGPFAETKEHLAGYYLIDVDSDEEARHWAAKIPSARIGSIEVRPVMQMGAPTG